MKKVISAIVAAVSMASCKKETAVRPAPISTATKNLVKATYV